MKMKCLLIMSWISRSGAGSCVADQCSKDSFENKVAENSRGIDLQFLKVSIPIDIQESHGGNIFFRIQVTDQKNDDTWTVMRRYSHFQDLSKELVELDFADAPFPPADPMFKAFTYTFNDDRLRKRTDALDKWIRKAVEKVADERGSLKDTMTARVNDFLMKERSISRVGLSLLPDSYASCDTMFGYRTDYHGIFVQQPSNSYRVMRRYSAFSQLHKDLLGGVGSDLDTQFATEFPPKLGVFSTLTEEHMNNRREGLEIWMQKVMSHPAYECPCWKKRVAEFLDPERHPEEAFKTNCKWRKWRWEL